MNWAIFCREGHPQGYGGLSSQDVKWDPDEETYIVGHSVKDQFGNYMQTAAHGYVTVAVLCETDEDLEIAKSTVAGMVWFQWDKRLDSWYGGKLDFTCAIPAPDRRPLVPYSSKLEVVAWGGSKKMPLWHSIGDNRAVAVLTVPQFLQQLHPLKWGNRG